MNTQLAFGLGMLVVVAIGTIIAVVTGMLKVNHLGRKLSELDNSVANKLEGIERNLTEVRGELHRRIDSEYEASSNEIRDLYRTIDSRFDKFENKITGKQFLKD